LPISAVLPPSGDARSLACAPATLVPLNTTKAKQQALVEDDDTIESYRCSAAAA
jgi:hypothetical protein